MLGLVGILVTSCERESIVIEDLEGLEVSAVEKITSVEELENLMKAEGYESSKEFADEFLSSLGLRGNCIDGPWEANSCSAATTIWPVKTNGSSNYFGGCITNVVDFYKIRVANKYYYACAAKVNSDGRYLLRARVANGKLIVQNLAFYGTNLDIGLYNSSCNRIALGRNSVSTSI